MKTLCLIAHRNQSVKTTMCFTGVLPHLFQVVMLNQANCLLAAASYLLFSSNSHHKSEYKSAQTKPNLPSTHGSVINLLI